LTEITWKWSNLNKMTSTNNKTTSVFTWLVQILIDTIIVILKICMFVYVTTVLIVKTPFFTQFFTTLYLNRTTFN
jgi:ABC-type bacteriocin/lantibiotic exporter with double-glycine peptidase domain